jgi:hypothetical protein
MSDWFQPIVDGFAGLNSFFGFVIPILLPLVLLIFIGATAVYLVKGGVRVVS